MAVRNPKFTYTHLLREAGSGIITSTSTAFDSSFPVTRLYDDRSKMLGGPTSGSALFDLRFDRGASAVTATKKVFEQEYNRLIIPKGHNIGQISSVSTKYEPDGDDTGYLNLSTLDGFSSGSFVAPSHTFSPQFAASTQTIQSGSAPGLQFGFGDGGTNGAVAVRLGELVVGTTVSPTLGVDVEWDDYYLPVGESIQTRSGESYFNNTGQNLRTFTLSHVVPEGTDSRMYDDLIRSTGIRANPFYYEAPCEMEENEILLNLLDSTTGVSSGGTLSTSTSDLPGTDGVTSYLVFTAGADSTTAVFFDIDLADGLPFDMRDCILQIDTRIPTSYWPNADADMTWRVHGAYRDGFTNITSSSEYAPWRALLPASTADLWSRVQTDLDDDVFLVDAEGTAGTDPVRLLMLVLRTLSSGDKVHLSNLKLIRKSSLPVCVETVAYSKRQVSANPSGIVLWQYDFEFVEVSS